jgi:hypothetical protein
MASLAAMTSVTLLLPSAQPAVATLGEHVGNQVASNVETAGTDLAGVAERFARLAAEWQEDTAFASGQEIMVHPAYQQIIGMGAPALPLILRAMTENPAHWFWALNAITGEDPAVATTSFADATRAWLDWGREHNLI